ncbi:MAG TPA: hypothetical protein PLB30_02715 [Thermoleophilia bacterium]|nr:hypothetical protein [Thermoleophilia bacterium]HQG53876.1 hypothetical protein [Thermoleophilia bacterium]HQJ97450.1 hypothetical protein [Thermoleophilia bacterium]
MNGWVLLAIGLASLGLVVVAFGYVAYRGYRLGKIGARLSRTYTPLIAELTRKTTVAAELAEAVGHTADGITADLGGLQVSLRRLQVAVDALQAAAAPYHKLKDYVGR